MSRRLIYVVLAVVVAAVVYFVLIRPGRDRGGDGASSKNGATAATGPNRGSLPPVAQPRNPGDPAAPGAATGDPANPANPGDPANPAVALPAGPAGGGSAAEPRTYTTDTGNIVRDHRAGVTNPVALPAPVPPSERTMSSTLTAAIYQQLAPIVRACGAAAPAEGRGPSPVVHTTLTVDVAAGVLTTTSASAVASDLTGPTSDQIVACVRDRAGALTVAANGEPDRSGYIVQYPIRLRR